MCLAILRSQQRKQLLYPALKQLERRGCSEPTTAFSGETPMSVAAASGSAAVIIESRSIGNPPAFYGELDGIH